VLRAPIPGTVVSVAAKAGQAVSRGDTLLTIEAMKMLNAIRAPRSGTVATVHVPEGKLVAQGELLVTFAS
jgi:biotin carboxyl carrier protein